jgi:hypothetical protein
MGDYIERSTRRVGKKCHWIDLTAFVLAFSSEFGPCGNNNVRACVCMTVDSPSSLWRFSDQDPGSARNGRVIFLGSNDVCQFSYHPELFLTTQHIDRSEDLDAHVIAVAGSIRNGFGRRS